MDATIHYSTLQAHTVLVRITHNYTRKRWWCSMVLTNQNLLGWTKKYTVCKKATKKVDTMLWCDTKSQQKGTGRLEIVWKKPFHGERRGGKKRKRGKSVSFSLFFSFSSLSPFSQVKHRQVLLSLFSFIQQSVERVLWLNKLVAPAKWRLKWKAVSKSKEGNNWQNVSKRKLKEWRKVNENWVTFAGRTQRQGDHKCHLKWNSQKCKGRRRTPVVIRTLLCTCFSSCSLFQQTVVS